MLTPGQFVIDTPREYDCRICGRRFTSFGRCGKNGGPKYCSAKCRKTATAARSGARIDGEADRRTGRAIRVSLHSDIGELIAGEVGRLIKERDAAVVARAERLEKAIITAHNYAIRLGTQRSDAMALSIIAVTLEAAMERKA